MSDMANQFVITRRGTDIGVNDDRRVYVTGPHFGTGPDAVFSSTIDLGEASRYAQHEAEALLRFGKWRALEPRIEEAPASC